MKTYDIVALGELLLDFTKKTDGSYEPNPGGAPANVICVPAKYGLSTAFLGKVGDDSFGRNLKKTLESFSVDTRGLIVDPKVFTTLAFGSLDEKGERNFEFVRKPGADTALTKEELPLSVLQHTKVFHFSSFALSHEPQRSATVFAISAARKAGAMISFDVNYQKGIFDSEEEARKQILYGIKEAELVKLSEKELAFLDLDPMVLLHQYSSHFILVTMGQNGCHYIGRDMEGYINGYPKASALDTTNAGDIFLGAVLYRYVLRGLPIKDLAASDLEDFLRFAGEEAERRVLCRS